MVREFDERNLAKSRAVCAAVAEEADTGKRRLTERERRILDMWPRFEDGELVWFGDSVEHDGTMETVQGFKLYRSGPAYLSVVGIDTEKWLRIEDYKSVKRPAPKVLDADGVEIHVGDTVWHEDGSEQLVEEMNRYGVRCFDGDKRRTFNPKYLTHTRPAPKVLDADRVEIHVGDTIWYRSLCTMGPMRKATVTGFGEHSLDGPLATLKDEAGRTWHIDPKKVTHVQPDSWERLEEDAEGIRQITACNFGDFSPSDFKQSGDNLQDRVSGLVRRTKALAGVEQ